MQSIEKLWQDESGLVLSAEVVTIGTVGVLGAVVGLNAASTAIDQELKEFAGAIRSLDQSYGYVGHQSCRAWTAGSCYHQPDVEQSLADLCSTGDTDIRAIETHVKSHRATNNAATPQIKVDPHEVVPVTPNQIPAPKVKALPEDGPGADVRPPKFRKGERSPERD
jgi:hypothetical protein